MSHWDDVSSVRAALERGLGKQLANDFRHDRHGEVFLALGAEERGLVLASGEVARNKVRALARNLAGADRVEASLDLYEVVAPRLDATALLEALAVAARSPGIEASRLRALVDHAMPRVRECVELAGEVAAAAIRVGDLASAIEAVRAGVLGGLDPTALRDDARLASITDDPGFLQAISTLFPPRATPEPAMDLEALSAAWNGAGRAHLSKQHPHLVAIYERGEDVPIDLCPRDAALADRVIDAVLSLRDAPGAARHRFDPADAPLVHRFPPREGLPIGFATILGPDDVLVRVGPSYRSARVLRLRSGQAELVPGVVAVAANRAHTLIALAHPRRGIEVRAAIGDPMRSVFGWPDVATLVPPEALRPASRREPLRIDQMALSGDGTRVLVVGYRQGVFLGSSRPSEPAWRYLGGAGDDMLHGDLSDDGAWLVHGGQSSLHELIAIEDDGTLVPHASLGPRGEYPHFARFTDDAHGVAINACHFYEGATGYFETSAPRGVRSEHYADTPHLRVIDDALRVYAGAWLPRDATGWLGVEGAFALVGASMLRVVSTTGTLLAAQALCSAGASVDYHPELGLLAVGTYAGQLHLFDARCGADVGTQDGWTRGGDTAGLREMRRWLLWPELAGGPVAW